MIDQSLTNINGTLLIMTMSHSHDDVCDRSQNIDIISWKIKLSARNRLLDKRDNHDQLLRKLMVLIVRFRH